MLTSCRAGEVYAYDFRDGGGDFEVAGRTPVVVLSPKFINTRRNIVNVVPLLVSRPRSEPLHSVPLEKDYYWSQNGAQVWAKCDACQAVPIDELDYLVVPERRRHGANNVPVPQLSALDLKRVRIGVVHVIDAQGLLDHKERKGFKDYIDRIRRLLSPRKSRAGRRRR